MAVRKAVKQMRRERRQDRRSKRGVTSSFGPPISTAPEVATPDAAIADFSIPEELGSDAVTSAQDETLSLPDPIDMSEGPTTPPTTYGAPMPTPGPQTPTSRKKVAPGPAARKQKLLKRVARTTGTTTGEARGIMKKARTQVRRGNTAGAKRTITRALSGGKSAGVPRSPARSAKAGKAATKITKRIESRQTAAPTRRRKK